MAFVIDDFVRGNDDLRFIRIETQRGTRYKIDDSFRPNPEPRPEEIYDVWKKKLYENNTRIIRGLLEDVHLTALEQNLDAYTLCARFYELCDELLFDYDYEYGIELHAVVDQYMKFESNGHTDAAAQWLRVFEIMVREGAPMSALRRNCAKEVDRWTETTITDEQSVIDRVITSDNAALCDLAFEHAVDIEAALNTPCLHRYSHAIGHMTILSSIEEWTPIHTVIERGDCEMLRRMLSKGASFDANDTYVLDDETDLLGYVPLEYVHSQRTPLFLICENDDANCSMLKAARHKYI